MLSKRLVNRLPNRLAENYATLVNKRGPSRRLLHNLVFTLSSTRSTMTADLLILLFVMVYRFAVILTNLVLYFP